MAITDIFKSGDAEKRESADQTATDFLKDDHDEVRALFKRYRGAGEGAQQEKQRLFDAIEAALTVHSKIEEEIFYPAVSASRDTDAQRLVLEAREEHTIVKRALSELSRLEPSDPVFDAKMKVVMEGVEHHAEEEEDDMFPEAKKELGEDRLKQLGARLQERANELKSSGGRASRTASGGTGRGAASRTASPRTQRTAAERAPKSSPRRLSSRGRPSSRKTKEGS